MRALFFLLLPLLIIYTLLARKGVELNSHSSSPQRVRTAKPATDRASFSLFPPHSLLHIR